VLRGHTVFGIREYGRLIAIATTTPPEPGPEPAELATLRETTWRLLGPDARARYEAFGHATSTFAVAEPHYHLNMLGVRADARGRGLSRLLHDAVHALSDAHPDSAGVSLSTETPANLPFYERFGYRRIGHQLVEPGLETWGFFRAAARH
jgi:GNAT superfamily N-acetyltransferase